ncbi:MAG: hypothetical protein KBG48_27770 [Kofleriaceae bacterium]|nr:hypothetical protein [Kofleriaceae bacterium]MBP9171229.1 hypothetical protein [Kofleriaceae bacterium]MBP9862922.1 hypothetical protein [Kofleriaceae bacterium]
MRRVRGLAVVALGAGAAVAQAQPDVTVDGCPFSVEQLRAALAREAAPTPVAVRCQADGTAMLTVGGDRPGARAVDLRDVPPALAPRVIALVAATAPTDEPPPPPPPPPSPEDTVRAPADAAILPRPLPPPRPPRRAAFLTGVEQWRLGAVAQVGVRGYGEQPLWQLGAGATFGALAVTAQFSGAGLEHRLGTVRARTYGLAMTTQLACTATRPALCLGAHAELAWQAIDATPTSPGTMAATLAAPAVHGAGSLSLALPMRAYEVAVTAAVGGGSGVVARVNSAEVLRLTGWTMGAGVEVRR